MNFIAILKDSLREALDTKVFYVMVGFSLLVVLLVGSIGYQPVSVEEDANRLTDQISWFLQKFAAQQNIHSPPRWSIKDFEKTNPNAAPWETGYRFVLVLEFQQEDEAKQARAVQGLSIKQIQEMMRAQFSYLKDLKVTSAPAADPKEIRYLVASEGAKRSRAQDWPHQPVILFVLPIRFVEHPIGSYVRFWESWIINWIGAAVALLISTIITAFFIPNMLRKGTVDLLVVKPISRPALLLYKYIGGLTFMFLNTVVAVVGIWLVLGLRTNMWGTGFLLGIFSLTFQFALYYAVSTLFAVLSRSPIVAILMTCLFWFVFAVLFGQGYQLVDATRKIRGMMEAQLEEAQIDKDDERMAVKDKVPEKPLPDMVYTIADIIHLATPHLKDLDILTDKWILDDVTPPDSPQRKVADKAYAGFRWTETISVTLLYIVVLLALSCWWFARKDY
jgi:ABC-type transport system involved in multi-copper enzyme maturation permease subunit